MSGGEYIALVLLSMAWLFYAGGAAINARSWLKGKLGVIAFFGLFGMGLAYFTINVVEKHFGIEIPWPWAWVLLPALLDVYCLGWLVLKPFSKK